MEILMTIGVFKFLMTTNVVALYGQFRMAMNVAASKKVLRKSTFWRIIYLFWGGVCVWEVTHQVAVKDDIGVLLEKELDSD